MADAAPQVAMTADEWIALYERKVKKPFRPLKGERFLFSPDKGMLGYILPDDDSLFVGHMIGDGFHWAEIARNLMHRSGRKRVRMQTSRNPKAFLRRFGGRITAHVLEFDEKTYARGSDRDAPV